MAPIDQDEDDRDDLPIIQRTKPEVIAEWLAKKIESGSFQEGTLLYEGRLAEKFHVARSSVRTALQELQRSGLVKAARGRGWEIRGLPRALVKLEYKSWSPELYRVSSDLLEVRMAIEPTAASIAATRATPNQVAKMEQLNEAFSAADGADVQKLVQADEDFHHSLFEATRNEPMIGFYESLVPNIREFRQNSYSGDHIQERSTEDHGLIVNAIRRKDFKSARWYMLQHLWKLYDDVRQSGEESSGKDWEKEWIAMFE